MKIKNCTPHEVVVFSELEGGTCSSCVFPASGLSPRVSEEVFAAGYVCSYGFEIEVCEKRPGKVEGLPEPEDGVLLIVSRMVLDASDRRDLAAPDTGPGSVVRDAEGRITGVKRLIVRR
jgi:hypothetical protein